MIELNLAARPSVMSGVRYGKVNHLALYSAFHKALLNRILHLVFVPVVMFTGLMVLAYVPLWAGARGDLPHLGTLVIAVFVLSLAWIDWRGALLTALWLFPLCAFAGQLANTYSPLVMIPLALGMHLVAWFMIVIVGHRFSEPALDIGNAKEDTNLYFRRGYFLGKNLGPRATVLDQLAQFNITALAITYDLLLSLGLFPELKARIRRVEQDVLQKLNAGLPPFADFEVLRSL